MSNRDEFLNFFDFEPALNQTAEREISEQVPEQHLDIVSTAKSLFKGTLVDFSWLYQFGGEDLAKSCEENGICEKRGRNNQWGSL